MRCEHLARSGKATESTSDSMCRWWSDQLPQRLGWSARPQPTHPFQQGRCKYRSTFFSLFIRPIDPRTFINYSGSFQLRESFA